MEALTLIFVVLVQDAQGSMESFEELNISAATFQTLIERTTEWLTSAVRELETGPSTYVDATHDCPDGYKAARALAKRYGRCSLMRDCGVHCCVVWPNLFVLFVFVDFVTLHDDCSDDGRIDLVYMNHDDCGAVTTSVVGCRRGTGKIVGVFRQTLTLETPCTVHL